VRRPSATWDGVATADTSPLDRTGGSPKRYGPQAHARVGHFARQHYSRKHTDAKPEARRCGRSKRRDGRPVSVACAAAHFTKDKRCADRATRARRLNGCAEWPSRAGLRRNGQTHRRAAP
jgi:hypothetical protein